MLIVLSCLTGLYYIIPGNPDLPSLNDFFTLNTPDKESQSHKLPKKYPVPPVESLLPVASDTLHESLSDTVHVDSSFPQLISWYFDSLAAAGGQIRIMYYGDSQIEGDRITSFLRKTLRESYGGTGPGLLLPVMPVMYTKTVSLRSSSNWKRFNYLSFRSGETDNNALGPFMTLCRYLPAGEKSDRDEQAYVRIVPSQYSDSAASVYDRLRLFYRNPDGIVMIRIRSGDNEILADTLKTDEAINELSCNLKNRRETVLEFSGKVSPDIYGISIESDSGLVVDNIPQRGSAGLEFSMVDSSNLRSIFRMLGPDLFILHYGLNIVKNDSRDHRYYENGLYRQIVWLKELCNDVPVLVMSLTDMAYSEGDSILSYRNIGSIRDAQKNAAKRTGSGFFDSGEAMGGTLSIVRWSEKKPPLAQTDYVHFTYPGADTLARLLISNVFSYSDSVKEVVTAGASSLPVVSGSGAAEAAEKYDTGAANGVLNRAVTSLLSYDPGNPFIFTTPGFWLFLLVVLAGYSLVYRKIPIRNLYLLLISLYFYFKAGGLFLFLLVFVTAVDYTCGLLIHNSKTKFSRRFYVILSLVSNLGLLAYFKYSALIVGSLNNLLGTQIRVFDLLSSLSNSSLGTSFDTSFIILPVGISFFTFQSLSYTIDVYRRKMEAVRSIIDFGFYVSFFPHLVAGPIVRASVFMPQVYQEFSLSKREFSHSLFLITKGLIKKIVISNFIAVSFVDRVFDAPSMFSGFENLMAVYGYGLQIYCDFSGYTDIAIGVALILGFRLPLNFNSPYKAASITDFWRRWHISLSQWLKDYLYISLGGNRKGKLRTYVNLFITMLLGGLWHGAALRFIIWGGLHGAGLVFEKIWSSLFRNTGSLKWTRKIAGILITFHFVNFCWIFFRSGSMNDSFLMINQIYNSFSPGSWTAVFPAYGKVFILIATGYVIHYLPERIKESYRGFFIKIPLAAQLVFVLLIALFLYQMRTTEVMPFIYFRF